MQTVVLMRFGQWPTRSGWSTNNVAVGKGGGAWDVEHTEELWVDSAVNTQ